MAEQFLLPQATSKVVKNFVKTVKCTITDLAHADVGWKPESRLQYEGMMGLNGQPAIVGRTSLPPHFYIEIPAKTIVPNNGDTDLVRQLSRGKVPAVLKALDKLTSAVAWAEGRNFEALNMELAKGNVSICIYHLDGVEVTTVERAKVEAFPKKTP